jgi:HNH endonuclease
MCGADPLSCLYGLLTGHTGSGDYTAAIAGAGVSTSGSYSGGRWAGTVLLAGLGGATAAGAAGAEAAATEAAGIPAGSTADAATSGSSITPSVRGQYFQDGAKPPTCSYCQQNPAEHLDHVIPRSQGGDLSPENLTPACSWCNLSKGARAAPVNPPPGYVGEWPPSFWPSRMLEWWSSTYGGS